MLCKPFGHCSSRGITTLQLQAISLVNTKDPQWIDNSSLYASKEELDAIKSQVLQSYENDLKASGNYVPKQDDWGSSKLAGFKSPKQPFRTKYSTDGP